ncbi:MAG: XdhC family protein [Actinomycetota bacterium]
MPAASDAQAFDTALSWLGQGDRVAMAMVVAIEGSSPRGLGAVMAIREDGHFAGSVSGGCVEAGVVEAAQDLVEGEPARALDFAGGGQVGLHCGGGVTVALFRPDAAVLERMAALRAAGRDHGLRLDIATGAHAVVEDERLGDSRMIEGNVFLRVDKAPVTIVAIGAVHVTQVLAELAGALDWRVVVVDPRRSFATPERFPGARLVTRQPEAALAEMDMGPRTAVVALAHVAAIDDAALVRALASDAFYVGALGSTRTHAKRLARLAGLGIAPETLARIHAPVGLDIGAADAGEIAVSVLAQVIAALRGKPSQRR